MRGRRQAIRPTTAPKTTSTTATLPTRIGLSAVPNVRTANSFAGVGAASISAEPTASNGEATGLTSAATRWPTPTATPAATTPVSARSTARG
jgi:hypothetical protein